MEIVNEVVEALQDLTNGKGAKPADVIRDFNLLLNSRGDEVSNNISQILETFQPTAPLGKLLRLKLIGRYSVSSEVLALLQSGDTFQIHQALKFDWFFEDVENPTGFILNILPKFSLSTRLKVVNRYAKCLKNAEAGNAIYIGLKSRYGVKSAVPILPVCGEEFVRNELLNLAILLPPSVLLSLLNKYHSIATEYIKLLASDGSSRKSKKLCHYKCVFVQLSKKDIDTFFEIFKEQGEKVPQMILGRRPLKKAIKTHFVDISKCYSKFETLFECKQFIHRLSLEQVKNLYISSLLPSKLSAFFGMPTWNKPHEYLDFVRASVRADIVVSTFKLKYKKDCLSSDLVHKFGLEWLEYLPIEARIEWVNNKVPRLNAAEEQAEAIAYLPVETSLPRLKQLITAQSNANARSEIAKHMVKTLKFNQCYSGIKGLVQYFVQRFRNETKTFRQTIISEIGLLGQLLLKMDWDDWSSVYEFVDLIKLNDEIRFCQGGLRSIYSQQIHACFLKKLDVHPYLLGYVEFEQSANESVKRLTFQVGKGTPYHRQCIEWFLKELPNLKIASKEDDPYSSIALTLLDTVIDYNCHHKKSKIELPDWLVNEVENTVISTDPAKLSWYMMRVFEQLSKNKNFELRDRLLLHHFPMYMGSSILCSFLKNCPDLILSNLEFIINKILKEFNGWYDDYEYFFRRCRLYNDVRVGIIKACFTELDQAVGADEREQIRIKTNAVNALARLMEPISYLEFCLSRLQVENKTKEHSTEVKMNYAVQRAVSKSLSRISSPLETLPVLRKITGDHSRIVGGSLTAVCVRIPENIILHVLEEWVGSPVSQRKHSLRLMSKIAPVEYSKAVFEKLFKTEKETSVRLVLFLHIRNIYISNPSDMMNTFISIVQQLKEDDKEILDKLFDMDNIDDAYLSKYIQLFWQLIDSKWNHILPNGKSRIVESVDQKVIKLLSNDVCDTLLAHELALKLPKRSPSQYVCLYLLNSPSDEVQTHRLDTVMAALEPFIKNMWDKYEQFAAGHVFVVRYLISDIVDSLCIGSLNTGDSERASAVLSSMKESLLKSVELKDVFKECIKIDAYSLYLSLKGSDVESTYASALADLYNDYVQKYDSEFRYSLIRQLTCDIPMVSNTKLAHELLKNHCHPSCHVLATKILSNELTEENQSLFRTIIEVLSSSNHPHVQAAASDYFRTLEVSTVLSTDNLWTKFPVSC